MDYEPRMRQVRIASQLYLYTIGKWPYPDTFHFFHTNLAELVANNFHIKQKTWLNPYELASLANYVALFGYSGRKQRPMFNTADALNALKNLWKLAEAEGDYSDDPSSEATFALRWVYQQMPFSTHPLRVARVLSLMRNLFSTPELETYMQKKFSLTGQNFIETSTRLLDDFSKSYRRTEDNLHSLGNSQDVLTTLALLAADRPTRLAFFKGKLKVKSPVEIPYELNTLLRYPLVKHESGYYAPYPALIGYGATRGLFFRLCEEDGDEFRRPFVRSTEEKTASIIASMLPNAEILREEDERRLGWTGKTNDVTAILGDSALLIECKLSGLFVEAKRTASPSAIIADVRKQIADGQKRRGLFQMYDKCEAIRTKALPAKLNEKYKNVKQLFPVLLLFDEVNFANAEETLGNIIKDELDAFGVKDFEYQIWHMEELSWLSEYCGDSSMEWIAEKFSPKHKTIGLNSFVGEKMGIDFLKPTMYMPQGDTRSFSVLL